MPSETLTRDQIAASYLDQLRYTPYPVQEEALLAWYTSNKGVMVCAPTGTGKTLIAEAAVFEALHTGSIAYYTTPLIALTEQKFQELQEAAARWGFNPNDIGLVTGNRRVNTGANVLVVVAEILLNRLLHPSAFDFTDVAAVVMDEFHSISDPERGIVWELTLGLLPEHVRLLLLSATVGNAGEFTHWLAVQHGRRLDLVQSQDRKVPLVYQWVGDTLLNEQIEVMARGDDASRLTPALIFCFNREECWTVAEQLKGKDLLSRERQAQLVDELAQHDWTQGAGPKMRQILLRGVGVHHAGVLPKYRRIVENLFQRKLLSICVCTETLSAGINLPARSVVLPTLVKGPPNKKKMLDASIAHQIFGRAGRPQFDTQGYVFALAHEDDVKILRWQEKYDSIPEDTKDPGLMKAKKALKKKKPTRNANITYWNEAQFEKLVKAPPSHLSSKGPLPWRLLAYMLQLSPEVEPIRRLVSRRLMDSKRLEQGQKQLDQMLFVLWKAGYVELEPKPPLGAEQPVANTASEPAPEAVAEPPKPLGWLTQAQERAAGKPAAQTKSSIKAQADPNADGEEEKPRYRPEIARPTPALDKLSMLRSVNPLYGVFIANMLGIADEAERYQAWESVLELPRSLSRQLGVPPQDRLPPGPLATGRVDVTLLHLGLATQDELIAKKRDDEDEQQRRHRGAFEEPPPRVLTLAEKLRLLFDHEFPGVHDLITVPAWAAGEVMLGFGGDFNKYITSNALQKQEGIVFRHLLRMILLLAEFEPLCPPEWEPIAWSDELRRTAEAITECCRHVDPSSTEETIEQARHLGQPDSW